MTFEELDREIELKIEELSNKKEKNRFLYINNYSCDIDTLEDFKKFDVLGFLSAYYYLHHKDANIEEISDFTNNLSTLINDFKMYEIENLLSTLLVIKKQNNLENLKKYLSDNDNIIFLNDLKKISATLPLKVMNLKKKVFQSNLNIFSLIDDFRENDTIIVNIINFYQQYQKMVMVVEHIEKKHNNSLSNLEISEALHNDINKMIIMIDELDEYLKEYSRISKINKREITNLSNARDNLEDAMEKKELIVNYLNIINNIKDLKIKNVFLQVIKNHNLKYLDKLEEEYRILTTDNRLAIIALLNDYGIIKNSYNIETIMRFTKEDVEKILKIINILDITNDIKVFILENTNIEIINTLKEYLDRGIINKNVLNENIDIFTEKIKLDNLKNNLDIIKRCNLSISLFINNINILLGDSKLFNKNLNILSIYNLLKNIDTGIDLNYLARNDLDIVIDKYLELGCEKYLEKDLSLLNKRNLQKLEMLNILGIGVNSKEELYQLLADDSNFDIKKSELDVILNNKIKFDQNSIDINLDDYIETSRIYNFDGVKVSIIKVKRLISMGYNLYDAITYNMYLKEEDQMKIINILKGNNYII